jgi:hypothetical protein
MIIMFAETAVSMGKHTAHKQQAGFLLINRVSNTPFAGHIWPAQPKIAACSSSLAKKHDYVTQVSQAARLQAPTTCVQQTGTTCHWQYYSQIKLSNVCLENLKTASRQTEGTAPPILNLSIKWRRVANFTALPLYCRQNNIRGH